MIAAYSQIRRVGGRHISKTLISVACLCLWASQAIAAPNPQAVIKSGTDQVLQFLKEYPEDTRVRREKIRAVVEEYVGEYFDFDEIAKRAIGPRWRDVSSEKQREFTRDFSQLLFSTYIGDIQRYTNQRITYSQKQMGDGYAVIEALVVDARSGTIPIDYYLRLKDGNWKVYDVMVEGVGLVTNYRSQFDEILSRSSFDDLLRQLRAKVAQS